MSRATSDLRRQGRDLVRQLAQRNLYAFYRAVFGVVEPSEDFLDLKHYRVLAHALEDVALGSTKRLLIAIPPRHGKSLLGSVVLPCWLLGRHPEHKIVCASYGDQLAKDFALKSRELLQSEVFTSIFPDTLMSGAGLDKLMTTLGGFRTATSIGGALTGRGAHIAIIDDPMKASDAASETARNAAYDWFKSSLMSRFDKPGESRVVVIAQRLHQDDLIGRLKAEGGWTVLEMPGEGWKEQLFELGNGEQWNFHPGDLLFPERFDHDALKQLRQDLGEQAYSAQILQRPVPAGGALFKLKNFKRYDSLPKRAFIERIVQSWDPAFVDGELNAFTVCTTWAISGQKLYLVDVFRERLEFPQIAPKILELKRKFGAQQVCLEVSGVGAAIEQELKHAQSGERWLLPFNPRLGKTERAISQTPKIERGRVYLPSAADYLEPFEAEVLAFPFGARSDQVDSMVQFLYALDHYSVLRGLSAYESDSRQPF
jgi:predicted phage terminase large subunit-like protein